MGGHGRRAAPAVALGLLLGAAAGALAALPHHYGLYAGHNSQGARASLRVSPDARDVVRMHLGAIRVRCVGDGSVRTEPIDTVIPLRVHPRGSFGGDVFFTSGNAGHVNGRFLAHGKVSGHMAIDTRDDCFGKATYALSYVHR